MDVLRTDAIAHHARVAPHREALVDIATGRRHTYATLDDRVGRLAQALASRYDVGPGDRVVVLSQNASDVFEIQFACWRLGALFVPVNWRLTAPEIAFIVGDAAPRLLIVETAFADRVTPTETSALPILWRGARTADYESAIAGHAPLKTIVPVGLESVASLIYTSGTTGRPKGAQITHRAELFNAFNYVAATALTPASRTLAVLPLFHVGGLHCLPNPTFYIGGTVFVMPAFDPAAFLRWLADPATGISHVFAVPTIYLMTSQEPGFADADFGHVQAALVGGSSITLALLETLEHRGLPVRQGWGMTESTSMGTLLTRDMAVPKIGSSGLPVTHVSIRVVDVDGQPTAADVVGELQVRGPTVMTAYWNRPEANRTSHVDGWFRTGDAAYLDVDGYLYIVDRWTDMYISGGENVYPAEVENVLTGLPGVLQAAVIGIRHDFWGQTGRAFLVARPGHVLSEDTVHTHCRAHLAKYKWPTEVVMVDTLPLNAAGKVLKNLLPREPRATAPSS